MERIQMSSKTSRSLGYILRLIFALIHVGPANEEDIAWIRRELRYLIPSWLRG
jgi:hypothetical protein